MATTSTPVPHTFSITMSPMRTGAGALTWLIASMQAKIFSLGILPLVLTLQRSLSPPVTMIVEVTVRFRVGAVYKDSYVSVFFDDERVQHRKKRIMAPGEMEQIILQKKKLADYPDLRTITVKIEAE